MINGVIGEGFPKTKKVLKEYGLDLNVQKTKLFSTEPAENDVLDKKRL